MYVVNCHVYHLHFFIFLEQCSQNRRFLIPILEIRIGHQPSAYFVNRKTAIIGEGVRLYTSLIHYLVSTYIKFQPELGMPLTPDSISPFQ